MARVDDDDNVDDFTEEDIFAEISGERDFQRKIGYSGIVDDDNNSVNDWVTFITRYSTTWFRHGLPPYNRNEVLTNFRKSMIKTAALAVAAIEWTDRKLERKKDNG